MEENETKHDAYPRAKKPGESDPDALLRLKISDEEGI